MSELRFLEGEERVDVEGLTGVHLKVVHPVEARRAILADRPVPRSLDRVGRKAQRAEVGTAERRRLER